MSLPLEGMSVVDLTHIMAGPYCSYLLRLMGAEITKIERPVEGDMMRHYDRRPEFKEMAPSFVAVNVGKKSITVNLKHPEGIEIVRNLIKRADIVVENYRPGVLQRMGLGYDDAKKLNEKIIYCSVTGYGQSGPLRDNPAYDHTVQAVCGMMSLNGATGTPDQKVGFPVVDTFAGYSAAFAVISAVLQRLRTGDGQYLEVSMLDTGLALMISMVAPYLIAGDVPVKVGNKGFSGSPTADTFKTRQGFVSLGANTQKQYESLCVTIGRSDLVDDARFIDREARVKNQVELRDELESTFQSKSAIEWEAVFNRSDVPVTAVRSIPEIINHEHLDSSSLKIPFNMPGIDSPTWTLGTGFKFQGQEPEKNLSPPTIGQHTDEILSSLGYSEETIKDLRAQKAI